MNLHLLVIAKLEYPCTKKVYPSKNKNQECSFVPNDSSSIIPHAFKEMSLYSLKCKRYGGPLHSS